MIANETIAGFAAGVIGTVLGFPLDAIKTRMQTSHRTFVQSTRSIYNENSLFGFYRGVTSPLISLTLLNTMNFTSYAYFKRYFSTRGIFDSSNVVPLCTVSAAMVGPLAALVSTPFELVKIQLQLSIKSTKVQGEKYPGSIRTATSIIREFGIRGLYSGHLVNTSREIVFLSTYFTVYESIKSHLEHVSHFPIGFGVPLAGGIAGAIGWFVSFPLDAIKANIQGQNLGNYVNRTTRFTAMTIGRTLIGSKGILGLYSGVMPSVLRAFIVSSSRFSVCEFTMHLLS